MKNLNIIFNTVLLAAVIVLFLLYFNLKKRTSTTQEQQQVNTVITANTNTPTNFKTAYINVDTLLSNYKLYKKLQDDLVAKQKSMEVTINQKSVQLQKEAAVFQQKIQTNSFLSQESAQQQEKELYQKQQNLMDLKDKLSNDLVFESQKMQKQLLDTVTLFLKDYNKQLGNTFIFNSGSFLYSDEQYNITDTVIKMLNTRYETPKKQTK
ncbi:MAG: OmpH family outer membrane protein [Bacteroidales bacterium]|nr:OmpH family outer membrane protein [Bacteroidales bacterium]